MKFLSKISLKAAFAIACLALSPLLSSSVTYAVDFGGHWTGAGVMTMHDPFTGNKQSPCSLIDIQIEHLPGKITVRRYQAVCGGTDPDWGPNVMEIRGSKIFEGDEETGSLEGNLLKTLTNQGGVDYAFNLRLKTPPPGGPATLETYYGVHNLVGTIVIEGNLQLRALP